jgi:tRNA-specific 2-thiouridylase
MPLGEVESKEQTRAIAEDLGLNVARKPDSQEICFTLGRSYTEYLSEKAPETLRPGDIVDMSGKTIGRHNGIAFYTIGQRKRINVGSPTPLFVVAIDSVGNRVVVGDNDDLLASAVQAEDANWVSEYLPKLNRPLSAKIRYNMKAAKAQIAEASADGRFRILFDEPQRAITPGQAAVLYDGDIVVGGGVISENPKLCSDRLGCLTSSEEVMAGYNV